jgi:membrane protease YdiL (CAAX protease family)
MTRLLKRKVSWVEAMMAVFAAIVACAAAYFYSTLSDEGKYWAEESLNRAGWMVALDRDVRTLPAMRRGRIDGLAYIVACGRAEGMGGDALHLQAMLRSQADPLGRADAGMCRIAFEISQWRATQQGVLDRVKVDDVLARIGIREVRFAYTRSDRFLGSNTLAGTFVEVVEILVVLLLFGSVAAFRRDLACALDSLKTRMYLIYLPKAGGLIFSAVSIVIESVISRIPPDLHFRFAETMSMSMSMVRAPDNLLFSSLVHAPIVEELVFRHALFTILTRWWTPLAAAVMASAMFSASHLRWEDSTHATIGFFVSGMLLQWLYVRYRSVIFCMLAHATSNAIVEIVRALKEWS